MEDDMSVLKKVTVTNLSNKSVAGCGAKYTVDVTFDQYTIPYTILIGANDKLTNAICEEPGLLECVRVESFKTYFQSDFVELVRALVEYCVREMIKYGFKRNSFSL